MIELQSINKMKEEIFEMQKACKSMLMLLESIQAIASVINDTDNKIVKTYDLNNAPFQELDDLNEGLDRIENTVDKILEAK